MSDPNPLRINRILSPRRNSFNGELLIFAGESPQIKAAPRGKLSCRPRSLTADLNPPVFQFGPPRDRACLLHVNGDRVLTLEDWIAEITYQPIRLKVRPLGNYLQLVDLHPAFSNRKSGPPRPS